MGRAITTPAFAAPRFGGTSVHSLRPISALVAQRQCSRSALHFGQGNNEPFTSCERNRERGPRATPKDETLPHKGRSHTSKKIFASAYLSVLLSAIVLTGNFDADVSVNNIPIFHGVAAAAETTATTQSDRQNTQLSTWPPTSDQDLFKSCGTGPSIRTPSIKRRYWDIMKNGNTEEISAANERLLDHAVATINTMYYDSSGGFAFDPKAFYGKWKEFRSLVRNHGERGDRDKSYPVDVENAFATRENAVKSLKWLVSTVNDPYSKYLTREELTAELTGGDDGFLGLGALVDVPSRVDDELMAFSRLGESLDWNSMLTLDKVSNRNKNGQWEGVSVDDLMTAFAKSKLSANQVKRKEILSLNQASNLPIVKAIVPDSPAERAGLVVGDRIASVGTYQFTGMSRPQVRKALDSKFHAENYFGQADLTIAKPIIAAKPWELEADSNEKYVFEDGWYHPSKTRVYQNALPEQVVAFKLSHVKSIPTTLTAGPFKLDDLSPPVADSIGKLQYASSSLESIITVTTDHKSFPDVIGGDAIVHYATLSSNDSIFQQHGSRPVGYIRLTRFSKASTAGYINAINSLEAAGVDSYIIDLRNNYGGVIQEAMLTASTLLRDPHSVLCYTLNSRGGFRPQENMEYIIDKGTGKALRFASEFRISSFQELTSSILRFHQSISWLLSFK